MLAIRGYLGDFGQGVGEPLGYKYPPLCEDSVNTRQLRCCFNFLVVIVVFTSLLRLRPRRTGLLWSLCPEGYPTPTYIFSCYLPESVLLFTISMSTYDSMFLFKIWYREEMMGYVWLSECRNSLAQMLWTVIAWRCWWRIHCPKVSAAISFFYQKNSNHKRSPFNFNWQTNSVRDRGRIINWQNS